MTALFKKLNFKDQQEMLIVNAPGSFRQEMEAMETETKILQKADQATEINFALVFVTRKAEIDSLLAQIAPILKNDALLWFAYPKGTSKKYKADFNRDTGWEVMEKFDLLPVRQVAVDEDWSALRFRKREYIKELKRKK